MIKRVFGTASGQLLGKLLVLLNSIIFARALGPADFGLYSYLVSVITVLTLPVVAGLPNLIIREVSRSTNGGDCTRLISIMKWSGRFVFITSFIVCAFSYVYLCFFSQGELIDRVLFLGLLLIPLRGALTRLGAILNGFGKPSLAQLPLGVFFPFFTLVIFLLFYYLNTEIDVFNLFVFNVAGAFLSACISWLMLSKITEGYRRLDTDFVKYKSRSWFKSLLPFTLMTVVITLNTELASILLAQFSSVPEVGFFKIAAQGTLAITLVLSSLSSVVMPDISKAYFENDITKLKALVQRAARINLLFTLLTIAFTVIFGRFAIDLFYGEEYLDVYPALLILSLGHLSSAWFGCGNFLLNMTGNEGHSLKALFLSMFIGVLFMFILVPQYSSVGAAISTSIGLVVANISLAVTAKKKVSVKVYPSFKYGGS